MPQNLEFAQWLPRYLDFIHNQSVSQQVCDCTTYDAEIGWDERPMNINQWYGRKTRRVSLCGGGNHHRVSSYEERIV